jgi:hypothetical protein
MLCGLMGFGEENFAATIPGEENSKENICKFMESQDFESIHLLYKTRFYSFYEKVKLS